MKPLRIFIGFDDSETVAYHALCQSIIETSSIPVSFTPVKQSMLPEYRRARDQRQSNEFSYTRFLVPYLCDYEGIAVFMDLDMMLRTDIAELVDFVLANSSIRKHAVAVCKHNYIPKDRVKYLGNTQYAYPRKNWSSFMVFNCAHKHCRRLTPEFVNRSDAQTLHRFWWTHEDFILSLPLEWNWLVGEYEYNDSAHNVHWTVGGPWFREYEGADYAREWFELEDRMRSSDQLPAVEKIRDG